jgi:hypothetical protein
MIEANLLFFAGRYQLQAAIAALHDEAARAEDTDWPQILALYDLLRCMSDNPMVRLNHAIASAMVHGATKGLELLDTITADARLADHHRLDAVRAHLLAGWKPHGRRQALPGGRRQDKEPRGAQLPSHAGRATLGRAGTKERTGMRLSRSPSHASRLTATGLPNYQITGARQL